MTVSFEAASAHNVTLTNGGLTVTNTGTASTDQGAHVASGDGKSSGKYYYEITYTLSGSGGNIGVGVGTTASTFANMGNSGTAGANCYVGTGNIWANGASAGKSISGRATGDVVGVAVDLDNLKVWFKKVNATAGNWNGDGSANPATNTGGITMPSGTHVPFVTYGGAGGAAGAVFTANFGGSAFAGAVPSGFTSGWGVVASFFSRSRQFSGF